MSPPRTKRAAAAALAAGALVSCDSGPLTGPPDVQLGRAECAECGMIISEDRCSAAILAERDGAREHLIYDDIGCMLDDEQEGLDATVIERYVRDYDTREWVRAETAVFVLADPEALHTPMGSGLVAFAQRAGAERIATPPARSVDLAGAAEARRTRRASRTGSAP